MVSVEVFNVIVLFISLCFLCVLGVALQLIIEGCRLEKTILKLNKMQPMIDEMFKTEKERGKRW